jgi:hypothetical protein
MSDGSLGIVYIESSVPQRLLLNSLCRGPIRKIFILQQKRTPLHHCIGFG